MHFVRSDNESQRHQWEQQQQHRQCAIEQTWRDGPQRHQWEQQHQTLIDAQFASKAYNDDALRIYQRCVELARSEPHHFSSALTSDTVTSFMPASSGWDTHTPFPPPSSTTGQLWGHPNPQHGDQFYHDQPPSHNIEQGHRPWQELCQDTTNYRRDHTYLPAWNTGHESSGNQGSTYCSESEGFVDGEEGADGDQDIDEDAVGWALTPEIVARFSETERRIAERRERRREEAIVDSAMENRVRRMATHFDEGDALEYINVESTVPALTHGQRNRNDRRTNHVTSPSKELGTTTPKQDSSPSLSQEPSSQATPSSQSPSGSLRLMTTKEKRERRQREHTRLFGKEGEEVAMIESMLDALFDRMCDTKQPILWPEVPF